eukprot:213732_1
MSQAKKDSQKSLINDTVKYINAFRQFVDLHKAKDDDGNDDGNDDDDDENYVHNEKLTLLLITEIIAGRQCLAILEQMSKETTIITKEILQNQRPALRTMVKKVFLISPKRKHKKTTNTNTHTIDEQNTNTHTEEKHEDKDDKLLDYLKTLVCDKLTAQNTETVSKALSSIWSEVKHDLQNMIQNGSQQMTRKWTKQVQFDCEKLANKDKKLQKKLDSYTYSTYYRSWVINNIGKSVDELIKNRKTW